AGRKIPARRRIGPRRLGLSPRTQIDRRRMHFLVANNQKCGAPVEMVRDIEQMLGEALRRHAQHPADPKVCPGALAFGDEGIGRLLNTVVKERVGALQAKDQPSAGGLDRKSTRLNSSHANISYAVSCLKK